MQEQNTKQGVDTLSSFEEARKAFWKYCRVPTTKDYESSIPSLTVFDAVISETVYSFKSVLRDKSDDEKYVREKTQTVHNQMQERAIYPRKWHFHFRKEGVIHYESAICLKGLLPKDSHQSEQLLFENVKS